MNEMKVHLKDNIKINLYYVLSIIYSKQQKKVQKNIKLYDEYLLV